MNLRKPQACLETDRVLSYLLQWLVATTPIDHVRQRAAIYISSQVVTKQLDATMLCAINDMHFNMTMIFVMEELYFFLVIRPDRLS
jgi:hypothetical protein